jgi:glycosyltransferase involved in cell wall biosynthesis
MKIELLFLSNNRLAYTKLALSSLLADPTEEFSLTIWDNASTDGTQEYLSSVEDHRIVRKVFSQVNVRGAALMKETLQKSSADLVGIVADDFLVTPGWTRILAQAHADVPEFGIISCWHLGPEFFDEERARHKIQSFGKHRVLRHPWTDGCCLVKLKALKEVNFEGFGGTFCGIRLSLKGYVNGFYLPLIPVEHMDYPWSKHYAFSDSLKDGIVAGSAYRSHGIRTLEDAKAWHQVVVGNILDDPWDVKYYVGWRRKLRNGMERVRNILKI